MKTDARRYFHQVEGCHYSVEKVKQMDRALHLQKVRRQQRQLLRTEISMYYKHSNHEI